MGRVFVVGSINIDRTVSVQRLPAAGETALGDSVVVSPGGKGANAAAAAARAGAPVTLVGAVGDDADGERARDTLRREGVGVDALTVCSQVPTGGALIVTDREGDNQIAVGAGANARLSAAHVERALDDLRGDDVVLISAEIGDESIEAALRAGAEHGAPTILDPAPARDSLRDLMAHGPIVVPNESEATALSGQEDPSAAARALAEITTAPVIVTLGADGCLVLRSGREIRRDAPRVSEVVDSVGAGDAFAGALAAALADGQELAQAVERALAAAAESLAWSGARAPSCDPPA